MEIFIGLNDGADQVHGALTHFPTAVVFIDLFLGIFKVRPPIALVIIVCHFYVYIIRVIWIVFKKS